MFGLLLVFAFYCYLLECVVWLFGLFVGYVGYLFGGLLCFGLRLWLLVVFVCFDCVAFGLGLHWLCLWFMVVVLVCYVGDLGGLGVVVCYVGAYAVALVIALRCDG